MKKLTERLRNVEESHADKILAAIGAKPQIGKRHQRCPFSDHEDRNPSFRYDPDAGLVYCTCLEEQGCSLTDAISRARGLDFQTAVRQIEAITGETIFEEGQHPKEPNAGEGPKSGKEGAGPVDPINAQDCAQNEAAAEDKAKKTAWVQDEVAKMQPIAVSVTRHTHGISA